MALFGHFCSKLSWQRVPKTVKMCIVLIFFCMFILSCLSIPMMELHYDRVEMINGSQVEGFYKEIEPFRVKKMNRTSYVLNGETEFYVDLDETFEMEANFYFNRLNNNQYTKSVIAMRRDNICKAFDRYKPILYSESNENTLNWYTRDAPSFCPHLKVDWMFARKIECDTVSATQMHLVEYKFFSINLKTCIFIVPRDVTGYAIFYTIARCCHRFSRVAIGKWKCWFSTAIRWWSAIVSTSKRSWILLAPVHLP